MWVILALLSAFFASLVAIFGKLGLEKIDSTLATTIRAIIMALFLIVVSLLSRKFQGFSLYTIDNKQWLYIVLAGVAGALSWLFYFAAIKLGTATGATAIDRLSVVFVVFLSAIFLSEKLNIETMLGAIIMAFGAVLITLYR